MGNFSSGTKSSAAFTPAATLHAAGDVVGGAMEFTNVGNGPGECRMINTVELLVADGAALATAFKLHLYSVTPPSAIADDAAFDIPAGDRASYLGYVDIVAPTDYGTSQYAHQINVWQQVKLRGTSLFGYLVEAAGVTHAAVAHTVTLHTSIVE